MLCPEVWRFPTSQAKNSHHTGSYDKKGCQAVEKFVKGCPFNEMVSIILPGCDSIPLALNQLIDASDYYLIRNLKLSELVRREFVEAFIKRGKLTGISTDIGAYNRSGNVFAITPDGKLILSVNKDLYHILGLEGRSTSPKRSRQQFEITIDLTSKDIHEQSRIYSRIKSALSNPEIDLFDFQLCWDSIDSAVCPSSVARFFNDIGYKVEQHGIQVISATAEDLKIPNQLFANEQVDSELAQGIAEYYATFILACDTNTSKEINSYSPTSDLDLHDAKSTRALIIHCKGLLPTSFITKLMELSRLSEDGESAIFCVNAYKQAPASNSKGYIVNILNDTKYFLFKT